MMMIQWYLNLLIISYFLIFKTYNFSKATRIPTRNHNFSNINIETRQAQRDLDYS
jgi:hypothetical protein